MTIDILPDDVLLEIFDCYVQAKEEDDEAWHTLVHVCQKWRMLVFASPRRLNLQVVVCCPTTPVREMLDIWPSFPIVIQRYWPMARNQGTSNTLAALEHSNRIRHISLLDVPGSQMEEILAEMYKPFLALTEVWLQAEEPEYLEEEEEEEEAKAKGVTLINPDLFLGGSAPRLETFSLEHISILRLPKLLSSATRLIYLRLDNISYYTSPEAIVTALSTLTRLEYLILGFECPSSQYRFRLPKDRHVRRTQTLFPALTTLMVSADHEYFEDLVARIDAPQLEKRIHWE